MRKLGFKKKYKNGYNFTYNIDKSNPNILYRSAIYETKHAAITATGRLKKSWDKVQRSGLIVLASRREERGEE